MIELLRNFSALVQLGFNFVSQTIRTVVEVITIVPRFSAYISSIVNAIIPVEIASILIFAVSCMLVMMIIGRNG